MKHILERIFKAQFTGEARHLRRLAKIDALERENIRGLK
jgi:ribose 5-phosphate isomerase RpiB